MKHNFDELKLRLLQTRESDPYIIRDSEKWKDWLQIHSFLSLRSTLRSANAPFKNYKVTWH